MYVVVLLSKNYDKMYLKTNKVIHQMWYRLFLNGIPQVSTTNLTINIRFISRPV